MKLPVDPNAPPQAPPELLGVHFDAERQVVIFCIAGGGQCSIPISRQQSTARIPWQARVTISVGSISIVFGIV